MCESAPRPRSERALTLTSAWWETLAAMLSIAKITNNNQNQAAPILHVQPRIEYSAKRRTDGRTWRATTDAHSRRNGLHFVHLTGVGQNRGVCEARTQPAQVCPVSGRGLGGNAKLAPRRCYRRHRVHRAWHLAVAWFPPLGPCGRTRAIGGSARGRMESLLGSDPLTVLENHPGCAVLAVSCSSRAVVFCTSARTVLAFARLVREGAFPDLCPSEVRPGSSGSTCAGFHNHWTRAVLYRDLDSDCPNVRYGQIVRDRISENPIQHFRNNFCKPVLQAPFANFCTPRSVLTSHNSQTRVVVAKSRSWSG